MSKYKKRFEIIEDVLTQLVSGAKEEQFLYGENSMEYRKAQRIEKDLRSIGTQVYYLKTDIMKDSKEVSLNKEETQNTLKVAELMENHAGETVLAKQESKAADKYTEALKRANEIIENYKESNKKELFRIIDEVTESFASIDSEKAIEE